MNTIQAKASVRQMLTAVGGVVAGYAAGKGWADHNTIMDIFLSPITGGVVLIAGSWIWSLINGTPFSLVAAVGELAKDPNSPVQGVITTRDAAGVELAKSVPAETVQPAGSQAATELAKPA